MNDTLLPVLHAFFVLSIFGAGLGGIVLLLVSRRRSKSAAPAAPGQRHQSRRLRRIRDLLFRSIVAAVLLFTGLRLAGVVFGWDLYAGLDQEAFRVRLFEPGLSGTKALLPEIKRAAEIVPSMVYGQSAGGPVLLQGFDPAHEELVVRDTTRGLALLLGGLDIRYPRVLDRGGLVGALHKASRGTATGPPPGFLFERRRSWFLTLVPELQQRAYEHLRAVGYRPAGAVVMRPDGRILALVSSPRDTLTLASPFDSLALAYGSPAFDFVRQGRMPIGSIIKPLLALWALDHGLEDLSVTPRQAVHRYGVPASMLAYDIERLRGRSSDPWDYPITLPEALVSSYNTFFTVVQKIMHDRLGVDGILRYYRQFGFGGPPLHWNTAFPTLSTLFPIRPSLLDTTQLTQAALRRMRGTLYAMGIGEQVWEVNPVHVACLFAWLANGTYIPLPTLEAGRSPVAYARPAVSTYALGRVRALLHRSVERGTSRQLAVDSLYLFGKTGTASRPLHPYEVARYQVDPHRKDAAKVTWSASMAASSDAPDEMQAVVLVFVYGHGRNVREPGQAPDYGGSLAVPIARALYTYMSDHNLIEKP